MSKTRDILLPRPFWSPPRVWRSAHQPLAPGLIYDKPPVTIERGYLLGGSTTAVTTGISGIDKFARIGELSSTIVATLPAIRRHGGAGAHSLKKGYLMGGSDSAGAVVASIDGFSFQDEVAAVIGATLDTAKRAQREDLTYRAYKGFCAGGSNGAGVQYNAIEDMLFSAETSAAISATLSGLISDVCAVASLDNGYTCGGFISAAISTIHRLIYAGESNSVISATMSAIANGRVGVNSLARGFLMAGNFNGTFGTAIDGFTFASEACAVIGATLDGTRAFGNGFSFADRGYYLGGINAGIRTSVVEDMIYATETSAQIANALMAPKVDSGAVHTGSLP